MNGFLDVLIFHFVFIHGLRIIGSSVTLVTLVV